MQEIYKHDNHDIAIELIKSVLRQGWCLSKKLAVLAIVDENLDDSLCQKVATKLQVSGSPLDPRHP